MALDDAQRVVITGMATVNPLGDTLDGYYQNLIAGVSGIVPWKSLDLSKVENKVGGDLGHYDTSAALDRFQDVLGSGHKAVRKLFRSATFSSRVAVLTAIDAWKNAGLYDSRTQDSAPFGDPYRTMTVVAGHNLNSNYIYRMNKQFEVEPEYMDPLASVEAIDNNVPALVAEVLHTHGPAYTVGGACASGNLALRDAIRDIKSGELDRAVVTGALFDVSAPDIMASTILQSVFLNHELQADPTKACRPFDHKRGGFLYSHGSATLVVESLSSAKARGARIWAEVLGVKASANGNHLPMPGAQHMAWVMREVIKQAGLKPEDVDYANCHATGTPAGDIQELMAMADVFGDHIRTLKINAPISMLGHTCWASPLVETIGGVMQMTHGILHPTINIETLAEDVAALGVNVIPNKAITFKARTMLKNSFGFGGLNCCSLIRLWEE
jgi:3-oxoacyl-(acyl-carrier-protein) synthase